MVEQQAASSNRRLVIASALVLPPHLIPFTIPLLILSLILPSFPLTLTTNEGIPT
jgi:hypothetical protein